MPDKPVVLLSDLTSDLVYLAALVPYAFRPGRDVSYAWQNRMSLCPYPAYLEAFPSHTFSPVRDVRHA